jgi:hypothetical protein
VSFSKGKKKEMKVSKRFSAFAAATIVALGAAAATVDAHWKEGLQQWRDQRAQHLSAPDGWLSLVGLEWLQPGSNTFGSAADNRIRLNAGVAEHLGVLEVKGNDVYLSAPASSLLANGAHAGGEDRHRRPESNRAKGWNADAARYPSRGPLRAPHQGFTSAHSR